MNHRYLFVAGLVALLLAVVIGVAAAAPGHVTDPDAAQALAQVRQATLKYRDVAVALDEGYVTDGECVAGPDGAMGYHYVRVDRLFDGQVNATEPEVLLYIESGGKLRLTGVEYLVLVDKVSDAPSLFGETFEGPSEGHGPGPHYEMHVWLWQANPKGIFAPFNPNLSC